MAMAAIHLPKDYHNRSEYVMWNYNELVDLNKSRIIDTIPILQVIDLNVFRLEGTDYVYSLKYESWYKDPAGKYSPIEDLMAFSLESILESLPPEKQERILFYLNDLRRL